MKKSDIQRDALAVAERDQIENFKASDSWALEFKK